MGTNTDHALHLLDLYCLGQATSTDRWQLALCEPLSANALHSDESENLYDLLNQLVASVRHRGEQREELCEKLQPLLDDTALDTWADDARITMAQGLLPAVADLAEALDVNHQVIQSLTFDTLPSEFQDDLMFSYEQTLSLYQALCALTHRLTSLS